MRVMVDLNVLLDVFQERVPHYEASARAISRIVGGDIVGYMPAHAVTTIYFLSRRYAGRQTAEEIVDWLLESFTLAAQGQRTFRRARGLAMDDFEDASLASSAEESGCDAILSRNVPDFRGSPVAAITPDELLAQLDR